ncbi:MAG: FlgD immunoglobulin-like domain containing protein [Candidatus Eisenbacteria bacterium]
MHVRWIVLPVATLALFLQAAPSVAEIDPSRFRQGSLSGVTDGLHTIFTVPQGQTFVLTDLTFDANPGSNENLHIMLQLKRAGEVSWNATSDIYTPQGQAHQLMPVEAHWITGLAWGPGEPVALGVNALDHDWICSWSGYLVPTSLSALEDSGPDVPNARESLVRLRANPFRASTEIEFHIPRSGKIALRLYGPDGRLVRRLVEEDAQPGQRSIAWNGEDDKGRDLASGTYFYEFALDGDTIDSGKAVLLR